jgi:hypothetical protein
MAGIHLVVSCAKRKTQEPRVSLRLRAVRRSLSIERRAREWIGRLRKYTFGRIPARDLYSGEHWHAVRSLQDHPTQSGQPIRVWVCSAGVGLVPIDAWVSPYSATFTPGELDAVCQDGGYSLRAALPMWWASVAQYDGVHTGPRTITDIARTYPRDFLLVALPDAYLTAVADDLKSTVRATRSAERFAILSVGGTVPTEVESHLLPAEARLQQLVGGSLSSLNARLARLLIVHLSDGPLTLTRCRDKLANLVETTPALVRTSRIKLTDMEVKKAIRAFFKDTPHTSPTPLLRRLRDGGNACKHSRFMTLFWQVKGQHNARA